LSWKIIKKNVFILNQADHTHLDLAHQMTSHLVGHSENDHSHHHDSHSHRKKGSIPASFLMISPFFNVNMYDDHHKIQKKYKNLKNLKQDLENDHHKQSENPFHVGNSIFTSSERMLQSRGKMSEIDPEILKLPAYINWAEEGKTTKIKFQGKCRSCYAFSGLAAVESAILIK
jgi:C1A family cysteine protease